MQVFLGCDPKLAQQDLILKFMQGIEELEGQLSPLCAVHRASGMNQNKHQNTILK